MEMSWIQEGILFVFLLMGTVSGMDPGPSSMPSSELSTLVSKLTQLEEQVSVLQQEIIEDKERITHLEQVTEDFERRVSLLESVCVSSEMQTEISGSLLAIGGYNGTDLRSAEVVNTSCDFPLPESRYGHISVTTTDNKTLVCGGQTPTEKRPAGEPRTSCLQFDYESKSWQHHSSLLSKYRYESSAVSLSRGTYVIGGEDALVTTSTTSEFLATGSSVWTEGPYTPGHGYDGYGVWLSCVVKLSDTEFVILGGGKDETQARVYNEITNEWREWPRLKVPMYGQTCVRLGDIILIADEESRRTLIIDSTTGSAREVASLMNPRRESSMAVIGGKAVILGGSVRGVRRSDGEMWNMDTETWEETDISLNIGRDGLTLVNLAQEIVCPCKVSVVVEC